MYEACKQRASAPSALLPLRKEGLIERTSDDSACVSRRQWHDAVREALHALQGLGLRLALQVYHHVADAEIFVVLDIIRDLLRRASQGAALAIGQRRTPAGR